MRRVVEGAVVEAVAQRGFHVDVAAAAVDEVEVVAGVALWKVWGDGGEQAVVEVEVAALVFDVADRSPRR